MSDALSRARHRRRDIQPKRNQKRRLSHSFSRDLGVTIDESDTSERINVDQLRATRELVASTPSLHACLNNLISEIFGSRGLVLRNSQTQELVETTFEQKLYFDECFLDGIRRACEDLLLFGVCAVDTATIQDAGASAFLSVARGMVASRTDSGTLVGVSGPSEIGRPSSRARLFPPESVSSGVPEDVDEPTSVGFVTGGWPAVFS